MKQRKRFLTPIVILVSMVLVLVVGLLIGRSITSPTQGVTAQDKPRGLFATPENLSYIGLAFTPVTVTDKLAQSAITRDKAIEAALNDEPGLNSATDVDSQLGLLGTINNNLVTSSDLAEGKLVWVVTFFGVETASSGPPGAPRYISSEYHVVINALTSEYIMAFPLYDVTPKPPVTQDVSDPTQSDDPNPSSDPFLPAAVAPTERPSP